MTHIPAASLKLGRGLRRARGEEGAAIVETALSLIILLTVVFGIMEICLALYSYHFISDAAQEGARYAIVRGSSCNGGFSTACPASAADIQSYVENLGLPGINPKYMTVTTTWLPNQNPGSAVQVHVQYKFPLSIPFVEATTITMNSSSQMVISN